MGRVIPLPGGAEMMQEEGLFPLTQGITALQDGLIWGLNFSRRS